MILICIPGKLQHNSQPTVKQLQSTIYSRVYADDNVETLNVTHTVNLAHQMERFRFTSYPSGKEPKENIFNGGQKLEGDWTNHPSITFKAEQSDFLLLPEPGSYSSMLPTGARADISGTLPLHGEPCCTELFIYTFAKAMW